MGLALSALGLPADAAGCPQAGIPGCCSLDFLLNTILLTPFEILTCLFLGSPPSSYRTFTIVFQVLVERMDLSRGVPSSCDNWAFTAFLCLQGRDHLYHINQPISVFSWAEMWCWESFPAASTGPKLMFFFLFFPPPVMCWSPPLGRLYFYKLSL